MSDLEKLRAFAQAAFEHWPEFGFEADGLELQELGVKHGLLIPVTMTGPCSENSCSCADCGAEFPVICYRKTPLLTGKPESI
jgi:hypothetical protein